MPSIIDDMRQAGFSDDTINGWANDQRPAMKDAGFDDATIDSYLSGLNQPSKIPQPFIDRFSSFAGRVGSAVAEGAKAGFGEEPLGVSPEDRQKLGQMGVFRQQPQDISPFRLLNEAIIPPVYTGAQTLFRGFNAALMGAGAGIGQVAGEATGGNESETARARRDWAQAVSIAALLAGSGGATITRAPKLHEIPDAAAGERLAASQANETATPANGIRVMQPGDPGWVNKPVSDQVVGGLPQPEDFTAATKVVADGDVPAGARDKIVRLYEDHGIHPAEVAADAQNDPAIKSAILSDDPEKLPEQYVTAYHGSPHEFDQFDTSKIGTGEGAQVYGHGLYFAENPAVAEQYRKQLAANAPAEVIDAVKSLDNLGFSSPGEALTQARAHPDWMARWDVDPNRSPAEAAAARDIQDYIDLPKGNTYAVRIAANKDHFLDWDKPISEQPPEVKAAMDRAAEAASVEFGPRMTGEEAVRHLQADMDINEASGVLKDAGLPGIKYLDAQSRNAGGWHITTPDQTVSGKWMVKSSDYNSKGLHFDTEAEAKTALAEKIAGETRNYVVFDDKHIEITHKNGEPVAPTDRAEFLDTKRPIEPDVADEEGSAPLRALGADVYEGDHEPPSRGISPPSRLLDVVQGALDKIFDFSREATHETQMALAPMATGTDVARATLKDFSNALRQNRYEWSRIDSAIEKKFNPEQRARMWNAADEESVARQLGESTEHQGLITLTKEERAAVEDLQGRAQLAFLKARDLGMVDGEGLPSYTPRMLINIAEGEGGPRSLNTLGSNLRTSTGQLKGRKHLTAEETEAAAKAKFGSEAEIARDIRSLPLATAKLEDAVAGRTLINKIREAGKRAGEDAVADGFKPSEGKWFTIDHPAFKTWVPKLKEEGGKFETVKDAEGNVIFEQRPLYVRGDFEGPIRAVLTNDAGKLYSAAMELKGKTMGLIMNSPAIHNFVEYGRAFFSMPGKMLPFTGVDLAERPNIGWIAPAVYRDGAAAIADPATMKEAIAHGAVPIGHRAFGQDITSIMEAPSLKPGRSWTAQILGYIPDLFDPRAGDAVKSAIDKAGDFWHNKLLWDVVARLQMGLYVNFREAMIGKGVDPVTAQYTAAHWANRFAGALPKEAMSNGAAKAANVLLFSRSFTIGNLGVIKDAMTGLPRDVLAQIERDVGSFDPNAKSFARNMAARKAFAVITADIAFFYIGNSIMQSAMNVMLGERDVSDELKEYVSRAAQATNAVMQHPTTILQPFKILESLSATSENEPGKQDRIKVGYAKDGTAIYARSPFGKIGEEFLGWLSWPLDMLKRKEGTLARPAMQIFQNDQGFGRKVYDGNADTVEGYVKNAALIAWQIVKAQGPEGQVQAAHDLFTGQGDAKTNALQTFGPLAGVTFSKGAPGGPAVGEMYRAKQQHEFALQQALPDIRRQIQAGDAIGAVSRMTDLGVPRGLQQFYIRTALSPQTRLSGRSVRDFYLYSTQEQRNRFEAALSRMSQQ